MSKTPQNESLSTTEIIFESSSSEFLRCSGADHNTTRPEQNTLMHALSSQHSVLSGYSSRFFSFLDNSKSVSFAGMFPTVEEERAAGEML